MALSDQTGHDHHYVPTREGTPLAPIFVMACSVCGEKQGVIPDDHPAYPDVPAEDRVLEVPCAKCGLIIQLPVKEIIDAGGMGRVRHTLCPGEPEPAQPPEYRMVIEIYRGEQALAGTGATVQAAAIVEAMEKLAPQIEANWDKLLSYASLAETDIVTEERAAAATAIIAEYDNAHGS